LIFFSHLKNVSVYERKKQATAYYIYLTTFEPYINSHFIPKSQN